jgi:hypothetical protein
VWLEGLGKLKKIHLIRTRARDLPAYSIVPQPTTLPRALYQLHRTLKVDAKRNETKRNDIRCMRGMRFSPRYQDCFSVKMWRRVVWYVDPVYQLFGGTYLLHLQNKSDFEDEPSVFLRNVGSVYQTYSVRDLRKRWSWCATFNALTNGMCIKGKVNTVEAYFVAVTRNVPRETEALFSDPVAKSNSARFPLMTKLFRNFLCLYDTTSILKYSVDNSVTWPPDMDINNSFSPDNVTVGNSLSRDDSIWTSK